MKTPLALTVHPEALMTVRWTLWLSYCGGIGERIASGTTARTWTDSQPVRWRAAA